MVSLLVLCAAFAFMGGAVGICLGIPMGRWIEKGPNEAHAAAKKLLEDD